MIGQRVRDSACVRHTAFRGVEGNQAHASFYPTEEEQALRPTSPRASPPGRNRAPSNLFCFFIAKSAARLGNSFRPYYLPHPSKWRHLRLRRRCGRRSRRVSTRSSSCSPSTGNPALTSSRCDTSSDAPSGNPHLGTDHDHPGAPRLALNSRTEPYFFFFPPRQPQALCCLVSQWPRVME